MIHFHIYLVVLSIHVSIGFTLPASSASAIPSVSKTLVDLTPAEASRMSQSLADASVIRRLAVPTSPSLPTLSTISSITALASSSTALASSNVTVSTHIECLSRAKNVRKIKFASAFAVTPSPLYAVTTQWTIHYPTQLRQALEAAGFRIIEPGDRLYNRTTGCDWVGHGTYSRLSVRRGKLDVLGTNPYPIGVPEDITRIVKVLKSAYPFTEITLILTFLVGIPVSFFGLCFCIGYDDSAKAKRATRLQAKRERRDDERREQRKKLNERTAVDSEKLQFYPPTIGDSRLLNLPPELHLEIISHLYYQEMKTTRLTCRYLHSLIPAKHLDIGEWKEYLISREMARIPRQDIPCFHCQQLKPRKNFPLFEQNRQKFDKTYSAYRSRLLPTTSVNLARKCIDCEIECALSTDGMLPFMKSINEYIFVCGACGEQPSSSILPVHHKMKSGGCWCDPCLQKNAKILEHSWIRPWQTVLALTSFSISMTGTVPNYLAPWACHATLCILTMGSCMNSYIMCSSEDPTIGYVHFSRKREILGTLLWAAVTATWTWELVILDWSLPGEGRISAVTIFCYFELMTFIWSCGRNWRFMKAFNGYRKRVKELPISRPL